MAPRVVVDLINVGFTEVVPTNGTPTTYIYFIVNLKKSLIRFGNTKHCPNETLLKNKQANKGVIVFGLGFFDF